MNNLGQFCAIIYIDTGNSVGPDPRAVVIFPHCGLSSCEDFRYVI